MLFRLLLAGVLLGNSAWTVSAQSVGDTFDSEMRAWMTAHGVGRVSLARDAAGAPRTRCRLRRSQRRRPCRSVEPVESDHRRLRCNARPRQASVVRQPDRTA